MILDTRSRRSLPGFGTVVATLCGCAALTLCLASLDVLAHDAAPSTQAPARPNPQDPVKKDSTATNSASEAFRAVVTVQFEETNFEEVIDYLRSVTGANIFVHWRQLYAKNISPDTTVDLKLSGVSAMTVLGFVLESVGDDLEIHFVDGIAVIGASSGGQPKKRDATPWMPRRDKSEESKAVLKKLVTGKVTLDLGDPTLAEAIDFYRALSGVNYFVNWRALYDLDVDKDTEIDLTLADVSVKTSLKLLLDSLHPKLTFRIDRGVVVIEPRKKEEEDDDFDF